MTSDITFIEWGMPSDQQPALVDAMVSCWVEVTNAGGAVGFPSPPIDRDDVRPVMAELLAALDPTRVRVILALIDGELAGWVALVRNSAAVTAHWATVQRLQSRPSCRGRGVGRALMEQASVTARTRMDVEHLWLALRGGMGLEDYYRALGWREVGRHPAALRLAPGDDRDEVFMVLENL